MALSITMTEAAPAQPLAAALSVTGAPNGRTAAAGFIRLATGVLLSITARRRLRPRTGTDGSVRSREPVGKPRDPNRTSGPHSATSTERYVGILGWLRGVARWNRLAWAVDASRALFAGTVR
jgi:hypothetical protein